MIGLCIYFNIFYKKKIKNNKCKFMYLQKFESCVPIINAKML